MQIIYWSCLGLVVEKRIQGTAYGILFCLQNIGLFTFPLIVGQIHDRTSDVNDP